MPVPFITTEPLNAASKHIPAADSGNARLTIHNDCVPKAATSGSGLKRWIYGPAKSTQPMPTAPSTMSYDSLTLRQKGTDDVMESWLMGLK